MYETQLDMESAGSFINCTNMGEQKVRLLALTRGLTGAVCFLLCVVTMVLVVSRRCLTALRESTQARLMAYLLLSTAAYLLVLSAHVEHYWNFVGSRNDTAQRHNWQVNMCACTLCLQCGGIYMYMASHQCYVHMTCNTPTPGHPSTADEAWYWQKLVLHTG